MNVGTWLFTRWYGELVGTDEFGNRYYREKGNRKLRKGGGFHSRERRWVMYAGEPEASRVPPVWHGWLHHTNNEVPNPGLLVKRPWQKEHIPNLTGTALAYRPPGSVLRGGHRAKATGDYEPWTPN
jgi:NADH:ubiquinone oxidoreductase subunit